MPLPNILTGQQDEAAWRERRKELLRLFSIYVYGETPEGILNQMEVTNTMPLKLQIAGDGTYEAHRMFFRKGDVACSMRYELFYPDAGERKLPVILTIDTFENSEANIEYAEQLSMFSEDRIPYRLLNREGFAYAVVHAGDLCDDSAKRFRRGIMEIAPREGESGWGAIGAWAWAASRAVDALLTHDVIDPEKITVTGVSRAGKTALWCAAQDERIAAVISCVSGCTGASILRDKTGEHIRDITTLFPHWLCETYASYAEDEDALPVDQHMLLALIAPRPLYLSDAIEDDWADPHKTFEAGVYASEVYRLLGKKGLSSDVFPDVDTPLTDGDVAYHVRTGAHGIKLYDWEQYLKFLKRYFR